LLTTIEYWPLLANPEEAFELMAGELPPLAVDHPVVVPLSRSPLPARLGTPMQPELLQNPPAMQAVSSVQLVRHCPAEQMYPLQSIGVLLTHLPPPLQTSLGITDEPLLSQAAVALQTVLAGQSVQAPEPLQAPLLPQVVMSCAGQSVRGSAPAAASVQVPVVFAQLRHFPEQSLVQQVLSKQ
jgi:hypothetical protein